jgi:sugar O-acyltransferase (sialic acid O-acetyltransferase NeuD family)
LGKRALIFGSGGHARVIASLLRRTYSAVDFLVEHAAPGDLSQADFFRDIDTYRHSADIFIGIGNNAARRRTFDQLVALGLTPANCISAAAFIADNAEIGFGVLICPGAVVMSGAWLGNNVIVNTLSSIDHDCRVGHHSQITAGVTFGGTTHVGEECFFGVKSATIPNVTIGDHTVVMAGSLVTKDAPAGVVLGGNPATIIKKVG